jgi:hypothetical protein
MTRTSLSALRFLAVAALALLVTACTTVPRPLYVPLATSRYGYAEQPTGDLSYEVTYRAPLFSTYAYGQTSRDRITQQQLALAYDMALLRASDLALARGMAAFRETRRDNDVRVDVESDPFYQNNYRPCYDTRFCTPSPYISPDRRTVVDVAVRLQVQLEPRAVSGTYDAADSKRKLLAAYPHALSAGSAAPPSGGPAAAPIGGTPSRSGPIGTFNAP